MTADGGGPGRVNFVHLRSRNYKKVQDQIFGLVRQHLPQEAVTDSTEERVAGALNFTLHIRMGRVKRPSPMPADVLMSHGLADKSYLFVRHKASGRPLLDAFEHVLVPGQWHKRRLLDASRSWNPRRRIRLSEENVHIVGWPRLDPLVRRASAEKPPPSHRRLRVLWAPSHDVVRVGPEQRRLSSYPAFEQHLPRLQESFNVRVSLHPANRRNKAPTVDSLEWADVVISDFGTLLYEAWALGKCVVLPTFLMPPEIVTSFPHAAEAHVYRERIGSHAGSVDELVEMVAAHEPPGADVKAFMDDYLAPEYLGTSGQRVAAVLSALQPGRVRGRWRRVRRG